MPTPGPQPVAGGDARVGSPRVLILSAPVGAGHDVAARRVAAEFVARGASVDVADGLELIGARIERFVIRGYSMQLRRALWSWRLTYAGSRSVLVIRVVGYLLGRVGQRRLVQKLVDARADAVVSTYPLVSAALASLRRRGRLVTPTVTLITDFDAHPAWVHRDLDANFTVAGDAAGLVGVLPPIAPCADAQPANVRSSLGIGADDRLVTIVGGAWGVGALHEAALAVESVDGVRALVVTGRNEELRARLGADPRLRRAVVVGYRDDLLDLMAASDVVVQHAGGMTCLEAFALHVPVVMFAPLPGHGVANAACMMRAGVAVTVHDRAAFTRLLSDPDFWRTTAGGLVATADLLLTRPSVAARVDAVLSRTPAVERPRRLPTPALRVISAAAAALIVIFPAVEIIELLST